MQEADRPTRNVHLTSAGGQTTINRQQPTIIHHHPPFNNSRFLFCCQSQKSGTHSYRNMATLITLDSLKAALKGVATATTSSATIPLSDAQYKAGFDIFMQDIASKAYKDFIIPQLSELLAPLFNVRAHIAVLEIGPGPKSVLEHLPSSLRHKITRYSAFEPNELFAASLEQSLWSTSGPGAPLPRLESWPIIHKKPFVLHSDTRNNIDSGNEKFNVILFCHSMYGLNPKRKFIDRALDMLVEQPDDGRVVVFHRHGSLQLDGLLCYRGASFPTGVTGVIDDDNVLDSFAPFIAGFVMQDTDAHLRICKLWREVCRTMGRKVPHDNLLFGSPEIMVAFSRHATALPKLLANIPRVDAHRTVKNTEARRFNDTKIIRPTEIEHIQHCVQWAVKHRVGLTVIGGGHSGHCLWPNVVSIDMSAFDQVHITTVGGEGAGTDAGTLVVAGGGCKTGDIIRATMAAGLTIPLGSRPSVGAGLWLQGGIGHLARIHGLACDAIVGAVLISVDSGQILCVGHVPEQQRPVGSIRPPNGNDLLWAIKGAGTNFGIVISITFKACSAPTYSVRNWIIPLQDHLEARLKLKEFDERIAKKLGRNWSADAYLYVHSGQLHLGVAVYGTSMAQLTLESPIDIESVLGPQSTLKFVDSVGLFGTEMYMSEMHGGHGGGKTSSFKRCLFLKHISAAEVAKVLLAAFETHPSPLCYFHLLQGGGAIGDAAHDATAFGCRDWDFACVITGVWPRDQDGTDSAKAAIDWVYSIVRDLLPLSSGAYGADLGPDPRDAALAAKAFGANRPRLARLKDCFDPHSVLAYACPLPKASTEQSFQKLIILVTGESCAGKDYSAEVWAAVFNAYADKTRKARVVSISDTTKREYAAAIGADLNRLLEDRDYKEQHRAALTAYFHDQVRQRPQLPQEHFLDVVRGATDVDVLLITGMRDEAPVAALSHLVADSRLLEVYVRASHETRQVRIGGKISGYQQMNGKDNTVGGTSSSMGLDYQPSLIFNNDKTGTQSAKTFAEESLLPFLNEDIQRLASLVRCVPNFPRPGIEFRHVLDIAQQRGGLSLCTSLLRSHFTGDWSKVDIVACCEAGGYVFAAALAVEVDIPLALIREAGKLAPPTVSATKNPSHVSSLGSVEPGEKRLEMNGNVIPKGATVVVVDDVLATGKTLCAVLELLKEANVGAEHVSVMTVAEFPVHRGRELLRHFGFGRVRVQSLLVFDGA